MTADFIDLDTEAAASLQSLIDAAAEARAKPPTGAERKAALTEAIRQSNIDKLMALNEKMSGIMGRILANKDITETLGLLSESELLALMEELEDEQRVKELLEIRYQSIRTAVFAHITETHRARGVSDPAHTPGEAPVPALGKRFTREGGKAKAQLDQDMLRLQLGKKRWDEVCKKVVVPAVAEHVEYVLDEERMIALVQRDPEVLEIFRSCVIPGKYGAARFHVRELKTDDHTDSAD